MINFKYLHDFILEPEDKQEKAQTGWQYLDDMVRAEVIVDTLPELWDAYRWFKESGIFEVIHIQDNLTNDIKNITVSFDFNNKIIGEVQFRCEVLPPQFQANSMLS